MQCLPVLSFHTIDEEHQELAPSPWGPPRKVPQLASTKEATTSPTRNRRKSSASQASQGQSNRPELQEMPGSFNTTSQEETPTSRQASAVKSKRHGAAALGATRTAEEEEKFEKDLAEAPSTRAHVPLPFADALGAHLLLSLPVRAGGGVLVFCETSILHVSCPNADGVKSPISPKASSSIPGKRRKASTGQTNISTVPRRTSGASFAAAISTSPTSPTLTTSLPPNRSNENGKRRRSTAGSQTQAIIAGRESSSPTAQRRSSSLPSWMSRILRLEMGKPVIVASATVVSEPGNTADDGVQVDSVDQGKASLQVLFGTHAGSLYLLTISLEIADDGEGDSWRPFDMVVQLLGTTPAPGSNGALTYLGENFISVASTGGDSVIVQIQSDSAVDHQGDVEMDKQPLVPALYSLKTIHQWTNLAPILDFVVDDGAGGDASDAKSAQARVITCSGTGPTGSLRIIRNGVILEDVLSISEEQVTRVWSISSGVPSETKLLILGYHTHSRVLSIEACGSGFQDISTSLSAAGLDLNAPILEAMSLNNGHFVIIQQSGITVWSADQLQQTSSWIPASLGNAGLQQATVSKASANQTGQVILSMQTYIVLLQVDTTGTVQVVRVEDVQSEVSALEISSLQKGKQAQYAAIALWNPWIIKIFNLATWEDVTPSALNSPQPSLIRSVLLHTFTTRGVATSEPHLLLGLGDGKLNSYGLSLPFADSLVKRVGILEKRSASMGSQPLHLRSFKTAEGLDAIFVSCDRPSVVYSYGKGLQYSSVPHREVNDLCQVQLQDEAMVLFAKSRQLVLSRMGQIQKLDVSTIELGANNPISLTICPEARAVAAVTHTFLPEGRQHAAEQVGKVMLFDYEDFEQLDDYDLEMEERPNCIESVDVMGRRLVIVGTGYTFPDRSETMSGRLLIFAVSGRKLKLVASHNVEGNTYAVGKVQDYVVACINSKVITYEVEEEEDTGVKGADISLKLLQVGEWACAFTAITLRNVGSAKLVIGDALRSLVILKIDGDSGRIEEVARDCDPYWTMAAEVLDEDEEEYLGCDIGFNLWTCSRVKWTESAKRQIQRSRARNMETGMMASQSVTQTEDAVWSHIMQRQAAYHYGDLINVMKKGALTAQGNNSTGSRNTSGSGGVEPRIVFGTAAGAIGIVAKVDDRQAKVLSQLELNLRETFEPVGRIPAEE
jgi:DNA damage-binding protein 1